MLQLPILENEFTLERTSDLAHARDVFSCATSCNQRKQDREDFTACNFFYLSDWSEIICHLGYVNPNDTMANATAEGNKFVYVDFYI